MEAEEVTARDEVDAIGNLRIRRGSAVLEHNGRIQAEGESSGHLILEEIGEENALVEGQAHLQDLPVLIVAARRVNGISELGIVAWRSLTMRNAAEVVEEAHTELRVAAEEVVDALCAQEILHAQLVQGLKLLLTIKVILEDLEQRSVLRRIALLGEESVGEFNCGQKVGTHLRRDLRLHRHVVDLLGLIGEALEVCEIHENALQLQYLFVLSVREEEAVDDNAVGEGLEVEPSRAEVHAAHGMAHLGKVMPTGGVRGSEEEHKAPRVRTRIHIARDNTSHRPSRCYNLLHDVVVLRLRLLRLLLPEARGCKHVQGCVGVCAMKWRFQDVLLCDIQAKTGGAILDGRTL
mmetsp:Transcript_110286/g.235551  ORF Transcript_110286/g.235551 Transcript_110286/m.235551 type:complete len:349 (-) Transcript_110286:577-1623(-)